LLTIVKPIKNQAVKQFIGLANYFRDHVQNLSIYLRPLEALLPNYSKHHAKDRIIWTPEAEEAFEKVKTSIIKLPKLFFVSYEPNVRIILETDACEYGIGAYLYQELPSGEKQPIAFVSKALTGAEQRWATNTKEAFAIYYAFKKLEYLITAVDSISGGST